MRFMRVVSLVAGITLLAAGLVGLRDRRAEAGEQRDQRLELAAGVVAARLDSTIARITGVMAVATPATSVKELADALAMPVCAVAENGTGTCSARSFDLAPDADVTVAIAAADGRATPVVVVARAPDGPNASGVLVASDQGDRTLLASAGLEATDLAEGTAATLVPATGEPLRRARSIGDRRAYTAPSAVEFEDGPWAVRATSDAAIRLADEEPWLTGIQVAVGAVLAAVALGGILADHRSLQRRATTDALTRLPNRSEFERRAKEVLARLGREGGAACVMVVDLDGFKTVNDTAGHAAGDQALIAAADRLRRVVRRSDVVGRWGGDEFVVLLAGVADLGSVPERAAAIAAAIAAAPPIGDYELSASVGAAVFPHHGTSLDALLRTADQAMYAARLRGVPHHLADSPRVSDSSAAR